MLVVTNINYTLRYRVQIYQVRYIFMWDLVDIK